MLISMNSSTKSGTLLSWKTRRQLPLKAHGILQDWHQEHLTNPYPTKEERDQLASRTGLTVKQVSTWFTNNRQRQLDPFEQWLSSSSSDEAASPSAIGTALNWSDYNAPNLSRRRHNSASSAGSAASAGSAFSLCADAVQSGPQRKGRRKKYWKREGKHNAIPALSLHEELKVPSLTYQCTFCHVELTPKAWKRHEESQHLSKSQRACLSDAPFIDQGDDLACTFCPSFSSDDSQSTHNRQCRHRVVECLRKSKSERTFHRKDNLVQHVKGFHGVFLSDEMIEAWEVQADHSHHDWKCGFCGQRLENWNVRATHIAKHFRVGLRMDSWDSTRLAKNEDEPPSIVTDPQSAPSDPSYSQPAQLEEVQCFEFSDPGDLKHPPGDNDLAPTSEALEQPNPFDNNWAALLTDPSGTTYPPDQMYPRAPSDVNPLPGLEMDTLMRDTDALAEFGIQTSGADSLEHAFEILRIAMASQSNGAFGPQDYMTLGKIMNRLNAQPKQLGNVEDWLNAEMLDNDVELSSSMPQNTPTDAACSREFEDSLPVMDEGLADWGYLLGNSNEGSSENLGKERDLEAELAATKEKLQQLETELSLEASQTHILMTQPGRCFNPVHPCQTMTYFSDL